MILVVFCIGVGPISSQLQVRSGPCLRFSSFYKNLFIAKPMNALEKTTAKEEKWWSFDGMGVDPVCFLAGDGITVIPQDYVDFGL